MSKTLLDLVKDGTLASYVNADDRFRVEYNGDESTCEVIGDDMLSAFAIVAVRRVPETKVECRASFGEEFELDEALLSQLEVEGKLVAFGIQVEW